MPRKKLLKDGVWLAGSQIASQSTAFLRTVILARLLTKGDMGIVALCQATVFLFDMLSDLNLGTFLIQAPEGDEASTQSTAQSITVLRGFILAVAVFFAAKPAAYLFAIPGAVIPFRCLAALPILRGLAHLDTSRLQRHTNYGPSIVIDVAPQVFILALAYPLCRWLHNYTVIIWLLFIQCVSATVLTQLIASRPYKLGFERKSARRMLRFGWPLLVNGILMFVCFQGDRIIIGAERIFPAYGKEQLATYSLALSLTMVPSLAISRLFSSLMLPRLARCQADIARFRRQSDVVLDALGVASGLSLIPFMILGGSVVRAIYGPRYADSATVIIWLAAMQAVRLIRVGSTLSALAKGDTHNSMNSNFGRLAGVGLAVCAAAAGKGIIWIAASGLAGEMLALGVADLGMIRKHGARLWSLLRPISVCAFAALIGCLGIFASKKTGLGMVSATGCELMFVWVAAVSCRSLFEEVAVVFRTSRVDPFAEEQSLAAQGAGGQIE